MLEFWDLLKYAIPALLVFAVVATMQRRFFNREDAQRAFELQKQNVKVAIPIRFRAYERLVLFLERISPENIVIRVQKHDMNALQLHSELLKTIRMEYEHNLSQQLYVSPEAWALVVTTKENVVKQLNTTVSSINPQAPAIQLSKEFIEDFHDNGQSTLDIAKKKLKQEVAQYF